MRNRTTILILGAAQFVMVLDTTVMNVSISEVVADLDTTVPQVQLAITAYALVMAAFMLTGAKLGDMWGRRRICVTRRFGSKRTVSKYECPDRAVIAGTSGQKCNVALLVCRG